MLRISLLLIAFLTLAVAVSAEVPQVVNYQGYLTDNEGAAIEDDTYFIKFKIYGSETGDDSLWSSGFQTVSMVNGLFSYLLGRVEQLPDDLFSGDTTRYLGISVSTDPEIIPRTKLVSSAFAYQALRADSAGYASNAGNLNNQPPTFYLNWNNLTGVPAGFADGVDDDAGGDITAVNVSGGLAGGGLEGDVSVILPDNSITNAHIQNDAVGSNKIDTDAVDSDEIASNSVGTSEIATDAVQSIHIATDAVGSDEIAVDAVGQSEIAANAVYSSEIGTGAVWSSEIADGSIQQIDLSFTAIDDASTQTITGTKTFDDLNIGTTTRRLAVSAHAFVPAYDSYQYYRAISYFQNSTTGAQTYFAQVSLPEGAVVTQLEGTSYDNDASYGIYLALHRVDLTSGVNNTMAAATGSGAGTPGLATDSDVSINYATIDNENFNYVLRVVLRYVSTPGDMRFYGAEIEYTITKPLP